MSDLSLFYDDDDVFDEAASWIEDREERTQRFTERNGQVIRRKDHATGTDYRTHQHPGIEQEKLKEKKGRRRDDKEAGFNQLDLD